MKKVTVKINIDEKIGTISPYIYGHFAEHIGGVIYDGVWVGNNSSIPNIRGLRLDIVEKLKRISPPIIRWPGGCFAECYDWRDGVGKDRPVRPSWWTRDDGLYESNEFGTHEFMDFCALVGAEPYLAVNVTSETPMDARNWIDYCNSPTGTTRLASERENNGSKEPFDVKFIGVGNENWGGGGTMCAEQYAWEYRKYATVLRNIAPNAKLIAGGANFHSINWTKTFLECIKEGYGTPVQMDGISFHYYFSGGDDASFDEEGWNSLILSAKKTEDHIKELVDLLCEHGRLGQIKLYLDEWGAMYGSGVNAKEKNQLFRQQVTMRDAVASAMTLNLFNKYCYAIEMANIAQLANCLSSLFLTDGDNCIETPIYHVFDMYKDHMGAESLMTESSDSDISVSASYRNGHLLLTLANLSYCEDKEITFDIGQFNGKSAKCICLASDNLNACNDFSSPYRVTPTESDIDLSESITIPKGAVMAISI